MTPVDPAQVLHDALANGNVWLAVVCGLAVLVPLVLKAMGKDVPLVGPLVDALVGLAQKMLPGKKVVPPADPAAPSGVAKVVDIKKDS